MKTLRDRGFEPSTLAPARGRRRRMRRGTPEREGLDRILHDHSGSLTFLGMTLGVFVSRKFFMFPLAVVAALAQDYARERFLDKRRA